MSLVECRHHALPPAARVGELAPVLAGSAVVLVGREIDTLVLTAPAAEDVADVVVFFAVIGRLRGRPRVCAHVVGCKEPADPLGRHQDWFRLGARSVRLMVMVRQRLRLHLGDGLHGDGDGQCHGYGYREYGELKEKCHFLPSETWIVLNRRMIRLIQRENWEGGFEWKREENLYE